MSLRAAQLGAVLAALVVTSGCATTRVTTSEPGASIWFDGRPVPRSGKVRSVGPPHTAQVVVIAKDGRRARALVGRRIAGATVERAFYTMGACLLFCWEYPAEVHLPLAPAPKRPGWDEQVADRAWLAPPGGSAPPQRSAVRRAAAATPSSLPTKEAASPERSAATPATRSRGTPPQPSTRPR